MKLVLLLIQAGSLRGSQVGCAAPLTWSRRLLLSALFSGFHGAVLQWSPKHMAQKCHLCHVRVCCGRSSGACWGFPLGLASLILVACLVLYSSVGTFPPPAHDQLLFGRLYIAKTNVRCGVRHIGSTGIASRHLKDQLRCSADVGRWVFLLFPDGKRLMERELPSYLCDHKMW